MLVHWCFLPDQWAVSNQKAVSTTGFPDLPDLHNIAVVAVLVVVEVEVELISELNIAEEHSGTYLPLLPLK